MKLLIKNKPRLNFEYRYLKRYCFIAGVDEAGVAPLAGPVVAAAVILDPKNLGCELSKSGAGWMNLKNRGVRNKWWNEIRDSKLLSPQKREELIKLIFSNMLTFGIGSATVGEIDRLNILQARLLAMRRAVESLKHQPEMLLVDGNISIPGVSVEQKCVVSGDRKILSIACASIVAKVTRDNLLKGLHQRFPQYGFDQHKGYPTKLHKEKLKLYGPCEVHRKTFTPVKILLKKSKTVSSEAIGIPEYNI